MTFLAPWAMALGAAGALGVVVLHLVARQRPAAYLLPTARFVPDRQALVSRAISRPHDLPLLLLRVMLLLCAGAAFARPVFESRRTTRARIVLLDRSAFAGERGTFAAYRLRQRNDQRRTGCGAARGTAARGAGRVARTDSRVTSRRVGARCGYGLRARDVARRHSHRSTRTPRR
jgi:hypothetical protein